MADVRLREVVDQRVDPGARYTYQPIAQSENRLIWRKTFGPDSLSVDPFTGAIQWQVPADFKQQSLYVGAAATDGLMEDEQVWVLTIGNGQVRYFDPDERLDRAIRTMKSGDTLILRSGVIDGSIPGNRIDGEKGSQPPAGTAGIFTTVIAEHPGSTVIDIKDADAFGMHLVETRYTKIAGIVVKHAGRIGIRLVETEHMYLQDVGIADSGRGKNSYNHNVSNLNVIHSKNFLIEGLYSWGHSRYKAQFTRSEKGVVRRSIARIDHYYGSNPIGGYQSYCSKDIVYQNNILIDSDTSRFWPRFKNHQNAFGVPATNCPSLPSGNVFDRNIVLNSHIGVMQTDASDAESPTVWRDTVGWDIVLDGYGAGKGPPTSILRGVGPSDTQHATIGKVTFRPSPKYAGARYFYSRSAPSTISKSIITDIPMPGDLLWSNDPTLTMSDSIVFGVGGRLTSGENAIELRSLRIDPELQYLTRPPEALMTACAGSRCGATILDYVGVSGSFWGESGFDLDTGIPVWPVPGERMIAAQMRSYSHRGPTRGGDTGSVSGDRGFARETTDLTSYIWGYLGTPVPPLHVHARSIGSTAEIVWAPSKAADIRSYNVYGWRTNKFIKIGSVRADTTLMSFSPQSADAGGPFRVTGVTRENVESGFGYDIVPQQVPVIH